MSVSLQKPWTQDEFFAWAEAQEERYEFDGFAPVAMVGGTINHSQIAHNIYAACRQGLRGSGCRVLGPDAGVATVGKAVRYPDAVITCSPIDGKSRLVPSPQTVFEVLSDSSGRTDRIIKVREYRGVPTILRYVIVEAINSGVMVLERTSGEQDWTAKSLTIDDTLAMPELGIAIPIAAFYEQVEFATPDAT